MRSKLPRAWVVYFLWVAFFAPFTIALWSRHEMINIVNSGVFMMEKANMEKVDWATRYKDWETSALASDSDKSISIRYGKEKLGKDNWLCDPDTGCSYLPNPLSILEYVDATEPEMSPDAKIEEAQARYWAAIRTYSVFKNVQHSINALTRAQDFVIPRLQSIIYEFTKQDDGNAIFLCQIKTFFINLAYQYAMQGVQAALSAAVLKFPGVELPLPADLSLLDSHPDNVPPTKFVPSGISKFNDQNPMQYVTLTKTILDFTLPMEHTQAWYSNHPGGNETTNTNNFLVLGSMGYTSDLYCGQMDGISGTGADNDYRISDASFHMSQIMQEYIQNISNVFRALNGLGPTKGLGQKMSDWMINADFESIISRLDTIDVAKEARKWSRSLEGYIISAAWASNKCYLKCQSDMNPTEVMNKCNDEKFANERYCPADSPGTLCQANCYTMMANGNHEKRLIGADSLGKHGFTIQEAMQNSWDHWNNPSKSLMKPTVEFEDGVPKFNAMGSYDSLALTVGNSKFHTISDDPKKSKGFPCFSGQDYRGLDTAVHLQNMGMGIGSTDWGEAKKANPRAWEMFQHHCPEQTRAMLPLTRYMNLICGQSLVWPAKTAKNIMLHNKVMKPDMTGKNFGTCQSLREKTENLDENTANYLFCRGSWPESATIFGNEITWVYTDWNSHWHRGSGLKRIFNHKTLCVKFMKDNRQFVLNPDLANKDWGADSSRMVGAFGGMNGTILALDGTEAEDLRQLEGDVKENPESEDSILDPEAKEELENQIEEESGNQIEKESENQIEKESENQIEKESENQIEKESENQIEEESETQ